MLRLWCVATQDHPRMGGEKFVYKNKTADQVGSPPHGRGKAPFKRGLFHILGITPAWAGKSQLLPCCGLWSLDHPRMGGEKWALSPRHWVILGSPPHGRGKEFQLLYIELDTRITPAWAGKSFVLRLWCVATQDHPRMGGEKFVYKNKTADQVGSPPHGRGKAPFKRGLFHILGITPAWAGKSQLLPCCGLWSLDHPRMGGEKWALSPRHWVILGSPPHGRGKG